MKPDENSKQKNSVLRYFIENESWLMMGHTPGNGVLFTDKETGNIRFYSYPKRIEDDLKGKYSSISREWAGKICKDLETLGILGHQMIRAARQGNPSKHYYLRSDHSAFKAVMKIVLEDPVSKQFCISQEYVRCHINENLVKEILAEKNTVMERSLGIWDWSPGESRKVHTLYYTRKAEQDKKLCNTPVHDPYAESFESFQAEMIRARTHQNEKLSANTPAWISFRLPVFSESISEEEKNKILASENKEIFKEYPGLDQYRSAIQEHYETFQRDKWILPILALIRSSSDALYEFLFGNWKPYDRVDGLKSLDFPIFNFLFTTILDIARTRYVPDESAIPSVRFRPDFRRSHSINPHPALLEIRTNLNLTVCYDASFDTEHIFYGAENGDVWETETEQNYEVSTWIEVKARGARIHREDIKDFTGFVSALRDTTNPISRRILERLSHRMQHLIRSYPLTQNEYPSWGDTLLNDLNRILAKPGFYNPVLFAQVRLTDEGKSIVERTGMYERWDYDSIYHSMIFDANRILFDESYPALITRSNYLESQREGMIVKTNDG